uniref:Uncharacterized protein n=1 Tax=Salarias fasciatus TaxID=181472 RepID=A0A672GWS2_SALFA
MPGTFPTRLTTILSLLLPVRTLTALLMVMLSRLTPFTSTSLSPTSRPASSRNQRKTHAHGHHVPCSEPPRTLKPSFPSTLLSTVIVWRSSLSSPPEIVTRSNMKTRVCGHFQLRLYEA